MRIETTDGVVIPHKYAGSGKKPFWTYDRDTLKVHGWEGTPSEDDLLLVYDKATGREAALNQQFSPGTTEEFVPTVQAGDESRSGLLLPAGRCFRDLVIPPAADLRFAFRARGARCRPL